MCSMSMLSRRNKRQSLVPFGPGYYPQVELSDSELEFTVQVVQNK